MQPRYVYICCEGLASPVIDAQVVRVVEQLGERGRDFDLLLYGNLGTGLLSHAANREHLQRVRPRVPGRVAFVYLPAFDALSVRYARWRLARWLADDLREGRPIVLHCRSEYATHIAAPLRRARPNVRIVGDIRGEKVSEYDYRCEHDASLVDRLVRPMKRRKFLGWQAEAARVADRLLCVCEPLGEYFRSRFPADADKVAVLRTGADERRFHFSPDVRRRTRDELGLAERMVFIYSGSLHAYQMVGETLDLFAAFRQTDRRAYLIFLTPDPEPIERKLREMGVDSSDYLVRAATVDEVPPYLMAADVGLVLREDEPINTYASPTKLGEYWLCGLPLLATHGVADALANLEQLPEAGALVDLEKRDTWQGVYRRLCDAYGSGDAHRERVRAMALRDYSRKRFLDACETILDTLVDQARSATGSPPPRSR